MENRRVTRAPGRPWRRGGASCCGVLQAGASCSVPLWESEHPDRPWAVSLPRLQDAKDVPALDLVEGEVDHSTNGGAWSPGFPPYPEWKRSACRVAGCENGDRLQHVAQLADGSTLPEDSDGERKGKACTRGWSAYVERTARLRMRTRRSSSASPGRGRVPRRRHWAAHPPRRRMSALLGRTLGLSRRDASLIQPTAPLSRSMPSSRRSSRGAGRTSIQKVVEAFLTLITVGSALSESESWGPVSSA